MKDPGYSHGSPQRIGPLNRKADMFKRFVKIWNDLPDISKISIIFILLLWLPVILNFLFHWNSLLPGY
jgi:hypothetical protein